MAYLDVVAYKSDGIVQGVRHDRHEDVPRVQQQPVEEDAADGGGHKVRQGRRVQRLLDRAAKTEATRAANTRGVGMVVAVVVVVGRGWRLFYRAVKPRLRERRTHGGLQWSWQWW